MHARRLEYLSLLSQADETMSKIDSDGYRPILSDSRNWLDLKISNDKKAVSLRTKTLLLIDKLINSWKSIATFFYNIHTFTAPVLINGILDEIRLNSLKNIRFK